jgi:nucleoside-diphosphate-sugar epimerase
VEEALEASGVAWTFLRTNFYMQNFARQMAEAIKHEGVVAQPETHAAISFIDARDIARVAAHVLTSDGHAKRAYNLTGPEALTYDEAAKAFSTCSASQCDSSAFPTSRPRRTCCSGASARATPTRCSRSAAPTVTVARIRCCRPSAN